MLRAQSILGSLFFLQVPHFTHKLWKQTDPKRFNKYPVAFWVGNNAKIELFCSFRSQTSDDALDGVDLAQALSTIVCGTKRQNAKRYVPASKPWTNAADGSIPSRDYNPVNR